MNMKFRHYIVSFFANPITIRWAAPIRTLRQIFGWRPTRILLHEAEGILVIRPDEIGDVILTGPFLRELRQAAPRAHITLLVKIACRELVEHCPYVDAVHALNFGAVDDADRIRLYWAAFILRLSRLSWKGFDLVLLPRRGIDWYNSKLVGHLLAGRGAILVHRESLIKTSLLPPPDPQVNSECYSNPHIEHEVLHNLSFLQWCGDTDAMNARLELWISEADRQFARSWLRHHLPRRAQLVVMHPTGGSSRLKQWPIVNYRALLNNLLTETCFNFLIIGGSEEMWVRSEFARDVCKRVSLAVGELTLRQLSGVLQEAVLFIGGDSGPMHLAAAAGTTVIAVFGPTSELRFHPWGSHCNVVSQHYACSPDKRATFEGRCETCCFPEPRCLTELSVESLLSKVRSVLLKMSSASESFAHDLFQKQVLKDALL